MAPAPGGAIALLRRRPWGFVVTLATWAYVMIVGVWGFFIRPSDIAMSGRVEAGALVLGVFVLRLLVVMLMPSSRAWFREAATSNLEQVSDG